MEVMTAAIAQVGPLGFLDDAVDGLTTARHDGEGLLEQAYYSGSSLPPVAQTVAADDAEIRQRLNSITTTSLPNGADTRIDTSTPPFAFHMLVIKPPDPAGTKDNPGRHFRFRR